MISSAKKRAVGEEAVAFLELDGWKATADGNTLVKERTRAAMVVAESMSFMVLVVLLF